MNAKIADGHEELKNIKFNGLMLIILLCAYWRNTSQANKKFHEDVLI